MGRIVFGLDVITKVAAAAKVHYSDYHFQSDRHPPTIICSFDPVLFHNFHPPTGLVSKTPSSFWRFAQFLELHCLIWNAMLLQIIMNGHHHGHHSHHQGHHGHHGHGFVPFLEDYLVEDGWNAITELATDICCPMDFQLFLTQPPLSTGTLLQKNLLPWPFAYWAMAIGNMAIVGQNPYMLQHISP